jgi:hypothetical protein
LKIIGDKINTVSFQNIDGGEDLSIRCGLDQFAWRSYNNLSKNNIHLYTTLNGIDIPTSFIGNIIVNYTIYLPNDEINAENGIVSYCTQDMAIRLILSSFGVKDSNDTRDVMYPVTSGSCFRVISNETINFLNTIYS